MGEGNYLIWDNDYEEGFCVIKKPKGIEKQHRLYQGISLDHDWPTEVVCHMNPKYPKDIQLSDSLYGANILVLSKDLKELLTKENVKNVEFLPVSIINHKERVASDTYFILNPFPVIDVIDIDASQVEWNDIDEGLIDSCEQLVLKTDAIPKDLQIFRPKYLSFIILIIEKLADKLVAANFTGLVFREPKEFTGI